MINKLKSIIRIPFALQEINMAFSRGALTAGVRNIQDNLPLSWEFSAFSQNGEDGIIDHLASKIINQNKYFIEIGSANGIANNTAYLAFAKKYIGIMVEGNKIKSKFSQKIYPYFNPGVESINMFVRKSNIKELVNILTYKNPDVFSLDIDGNDYFIAESILDAGIRPSLFVVEYNSTFGPEKSISIKYSDEDNIPLFNNHELYYGVSISGWKKLFTRYGYQFVTVESNGINAFFIHTEAFPIGFIDKINRDEFKDNSREVNKFKKLWHDRFILVMNMPYEYI
jgi:hypothetical protein